MGRGTVIAPVQGPSQLLQDSGRAR